MSLITVGIPSFNGENFIEDAVESIINQTQKVDEIIIIDDGSKDKTVEKIKCIQKKYPSIKLRTYINEENTGYQANWNKCFEYCRTKYLLILHQDDILKEDAIEKLWGFLKSNSDFGLVGGQEDIIDSEKKIIRTNHKKKNLIFQKGEIFEFLSINGTYIPCSSVLFDMEKINRVGYFETGVLATDELYWTKVLANYPIAKLSDTIILRRNHPGQAEWQDFNNKPYEIINAHKHFLMLENYEKREKYKEPIRQLINKKFSNSLLGIAGSVIRYHNNNRLALWYIQQALKLDFFLPFKSTLFWKILVMIVLNTTGLLSPLREMRKNK